MVNAFQFSFFYYPSYAYFDPTYFGLLSYRDAIAVREIAGISFGGYYPLNTYLRAEFSASFQHYQEDFNDPYLFRSASQQEGQAFDYFWNGNAATVSFSLVGETTRFAFYGPASGNTFRITFRQSLPVLKDFLQTTSAQVDLRQYIHVGSDFLFALRFYGFLSRGKNPYLSYYGGNNQVRSANYYSVVGTEGWFANIEFRFPLLNSVSSIFGQFGPVRGVLFFDLTRSKLKGFPAEQYRLQEDRTIKAFDALGSYGFGFEVFFLGLPIHVDFVKRIEIDDIKDPFHPEIIGGLTTRFWVGFDF
jgi:outer membrane protein assembly factor BamA